MNIVRFVLIDPAHDTLTWMSPFSEKRSLKLRIFSGVCTFFLLYSFSEEILLPIISSVPEERRFSQLCSIMMFSMISWVALKSLFYYSMGSKSSENNQKIELQKELKDLNVKQNIILPQKIDLLLNLIENNGQRLERIERSVESIPLIAQQMEKIRHIALKQELTSRSTTVFC